LAVFVNLAHPPHTSRQLRGWGRWPSLTRVDSSSRYQTGSCIVCGEGTDTGLAVRGEADWHATVLIKLGVPADQALDTVDYGSPGRLPGRLPGERYVELYRVCARCVRSSGAGFRAPVLAVPGADVPVIAQQKPYPS
jgi:hypothetical protein